MRYFVACVLLLLAADLARATTITTYSDRTTFEAANPGLAKIDFEDFSIPNPWVASISRLGATFSAVDGAVAVSRISQWGSGYSGSGSAFLANGYVYSGLRVQFDQAQSAFGMDLGLLLLGNTSQSRTAGDPTESLTFDFGAALTYTYQASSPWPFVGFGFSAPITQFTISFATHKYWNNYLALDNFDFGTAASASGTATVPEPLSAVLVALGLAAPVLVRRKPRNP